MRRRPVALLSMLALAAAPLAVLGPVVLAAAPAHAAPTELYFSEYVEGSSNNKALEIYNGTGGAVNLATGAYNIQQFSNGAPTAGLTINLTGTVSDGDVFVFAHSSASATILAQADQTSGAGLFNGDDALVLRKGTTVIDVIGQIGNDPGTEWGNGVTSTADNTLRRKAGIEAGDTNGTDAFDPALQWDGFPQDTFDGIGQPPVTATPEPVINEFSASTAGTDVEYVEVKGSPGTDLSAYTLLEVEGDAGGTALGTVDEVVPLGTADADGYALVSLAANALENGTITLLLVKDFTGALSNDLDTNDDGTFDTQPWASVVDSVAVDDGGAGDHTYGTPSLGVAYDGQPFAPGGASRIPDGTDTGAAGDWMRNDFDLAGIDGFTGTPVEGEALNTPGEPNVAYETPPVVDTCESAITPIHDIQGNGASSPPSIVGTSVLTEGVVVGRFQNGPRATVYLQTPNVDADPNTSEGIYVLHDIPGAEIGDTLRVRGTVDEAFGLTKLAAVGTVLTCGPENTTIDPAVLTLPITDPSTFEHYEGMLVTFPQDLVIAEYFNYAQFGEVALTAGRQDTPTAVVEPGQPAVDLAAQQSLGRILLDDARSASNPSPPRHPDGTRFTLAHSFRGGDLLGDVTGVMDYQFDEYRIQPTQGAAYTSVNERPSVPEVGGSLRISSFNVLNYFSTLDSRGANTEEELVRQEDKIVAALAEIDADVFGLLEIENNEAAVQRLVATLNEKVGAGTYDYISTGTIGTDVIKVALIYKPGTVTPVGDHAVLDESVDPRFDTSRNRPAVAQTFRENGTDEVVTVAVNHLKSKGSACAGDPDTGDGSGNCDVTRTLAAAALVDWMASDPTDSGSPKNLIIGDLNSYDHEDPIDTLVAGGYTDMVKAFGGEHAYSYVFDGKIGYLDHALASDPLVDEVTGTAVWHINADEPSILDYDMTFKAPAEDALYAPDPYRSSDHDPVIIGLSLDSVGPAIDIELSRNELWPPNHKYVTVTADVEVTDASGVASWELVSVTSSEPDDAPGNADGITVDDVVVVNDTTFKLRAERNEKGPGRVYTITYRAVDNAGNTSIETATVRVPVILG